MVGVVGSSPIAPTNDFAGRHGSAGIESERHDIANEHVMLLPVSREDVPFVFQKSAANPRTFLFLGWRK